jgi:two-component system response regulator FixJ
MNLPGMSGVDLLEAVRKTYPTIGVMVLTGFGSVNVAVQSMQLGAMDFIEKPLDETVLLPKIKAALDRISPPEHSNELSHAESEIVALIGQGLANKEIAFRLKRSIRTIENHRHRVMKKLGATTSAELIKFALSLKGSR